MNPSCNVSEQDFETFVSSEIRLSRCPFYELKKSNLSHYLADAAVAHEKRSEFWRENLAQIVSGHYEDITDLNDCCLGLFQLQRNHLIDPSFHAEELLDLYESAVQRLTDEIRKRIKQLDAWRPGDYVDPHIVFALLILSLSAPAIAHLPEGQRVSSYLKSLVLGPGNMVAMCIQAYGHPSVVLTERVERIPFLRSAPQGQMKVDMTFTKFQLPPGWFSDVKDEGHAEHGDQSIPGCS